MIKILKVLIGIALIVSTTILGLVIYLLTFQWANYANLIGDTVMTLNEWAFPEDQKN